MEKKYTHWAPEEIKFLISIWQQDEIMRQASTKKNEKKKRGEKVFREWSAAHPMTAKQCSPKNALISGLSIPISIDVESGGREVQVSV